MALLVRANYMIEGGGGGGGGGGGAGGGPEAVEGVILETKMLLQISFYMPR